MNSCIDIIETFNVGRDPERLALKYQKMRTSPFVFLRGTCHLFYSTLPSHPLLDEAPLAWLCGDLHMENFGSYKGDNRLVYFDINDFDEAAQAPCTWDLVRFLASVRLGLDAESPDEKVMNGLCHTFIQAYSSALAKGKARWVEPETAEGPVRILLDDLDQRKRADFLATRTELKGHHRRLLLNTGKALAVTAEQRDQVEAFMERYAQTQSDPGWFKVRDVARRIAGTGSLGVNRFVIVVEGKGSPDGNYLLDLKQALPSAMAQAWRGKQPTWPSEAQRVVSLQYRSQAISMAFLQAVSMAGGDYILRGLQPSEDRVSLPTGSSRHSAMESLVRSCGEITAWDHLRASGRQGVANADELVAFGQRTDWQEEVLLLGQRCAGQTRNDWKEFCAPRH
ncbi:MAG: DUF2252 domain-containing protein [Ferrovum sp.]|nr:DUF2252 domain-containing protein [Ferrovum sp.]